MAPEPATGIPGACIPRHAVAEWLALAQVLADHGPAPCEKGDPELWGRPAATPRRRYGGV